MGRDGEWIECLCRTWGLKLIHEIKQHERYLGGQPTELRRALAEAGAELAGSMEFQLVPIDSLSMKTELRDKLRVGQCLSNDLCAMGFAIVEATSRAPIVVLLEIHRNRDSPSWRVFSRRSQGRIGGQIPQGTLALTVRRSSGLLRR